MSNTINEIKEEVPNQSYPQEITAYKPIRIIGRGSFGSLYEAIIISGNHKDESVAVKEVTLDKLDDKSKENFKVNKIIYNFINKIRTRLK
jgi:hypothetical protein